MSPLHFHEDAAARRWLAGRAMRIPLVALKFGSPVLTMAALAVIIHQPNLAGQPLDVLYAMAFPFAVPFLLAGIYPVVRWLPQEWTLDATGIAGRGRVSGTCPWGAVARFAITPAERLPSHVRVEFRRAPAWRHLATSMMVPAEQSTAVEGWFREAAVTAREDAA
jgi:hypothetical protein